MIIEIGRVCRKTTGKDAGKYCVIVEKIDDNYVMTEGVAQKKKKTNIKHLEPIPKVLDIKKGASLEDVKKKLEEENLV
jgi:large subunit ribosomal protein L14e